MYVQRQLIIIQSGCLKLPKTFRDDPWVYNFLWPVAAFTLWTGLLRHSRYGRASCSPNFLLYLFIFFLCLSTFYFFSLSVLLTIFLLFCSCFCEWNGMPIFLFDSRLPR